MQITKHTLIKGLKDEVPGFVIDPDSAEDGLGYPIINDLARYICQEADVAYWTSDASGSDEVKRAILFLERCLERGDQYVRDLVHECLDTLRSCSRITQIQPDFGVLTLRLWNEFFKP